MREREERGGREGGKEGDGREREKEGNRGIKGELGGGKERSEGRKVIGASAVRKGVWR